MSVVCAHWICDHIEPLRTVICIYICIVDRHESAAITKYLCIHLFSSHVSENTQASIFTPNYIKVILLLFRKGEGSPIKLWTLILSCFISYRCCYRRLQIPLSPELNTAYSQETGMNTSYIRYQMEFLLLKIYIFCLAKFSGKSIENYCPKIET